MGGAPCQAPQEKLQGIFCVIWGGKGLQFFPNSLLTDLEFPQNQVGVVGNWNNVITMVKKQEKM